MSLIDELERLKDLKRSGAISNDEYETAKAKILDRTSERINYEGYGRRAPVDANMWSMFIHLSLYAGYIIPLAGLIAPIVMWQIKKDESPAIDLHGRIVVNWIITSIILWVIFAILCIVIIGIPLLMLMGLVCMIFPVIGGIKASNGEIWKYPCSIEFFTVDMNYEKGRVFNNY